MKVQVVFSFFLCKKPIGPKLRKEEKMGFLFVCLPDNYSYASSTKYEMAAL